MQRKTGEDGFTLIETLVALVIFVACYLVIYHSVALGWRGVQVAHTEAGAARLAQGLLTAAGVDSPLRDEQQSGRADGYNWTVDVKRRIEPETDATAMGLAGYWVTVDITWQEGPLRKTRGLTLSTLKLGRAP
jgi:prepilin-type N-terminal cleavage/methylation domain-containing protein